MRTGLLIVALLAALIAPAWAGDVEIELTGGNVEGTVRGQGTATVEARVTNVSEREIQGLRIAVYYSTVDLAPADPDSADWRIHEFVFEPPLKPGDGTTLRFSDENAAEYILIEERYVLAGAGMTYNGQPVSFESGLEERDGVKYVATRDLVNVIGGSLSYDAATYEVVILRQGIEVRFKENSDRVKVDGQAQTMDSKVISIDGSSYLPLLEFCPLVGVDVMHDAAFDLITLTD